MLGRTGPSSPDHSSCTDLQSQSQPEEEEEAEEEEGDELGHAETYADYVPSKCECPALRNPSRGGGCWLLQVSGETWELWAGLGATSIIPARHSA